MEQLKDKTAVVTGAGSGIGLALASALSSEGMRLVLADIDGASLDAAAQLLVDLGADADTISTKRTDVSSADEVDALADHAFDSFGSVELLVNNAGVFAGGLIWEREAADFDFVLGVNLGGFLHGISAFLPRMIAQDDEGHIVNTCSIAGLLGSTFCGPYAISKFAALAATETLANDLASTGSKLKVTALCPGMVATSLDLSSKRSRPAALATAESADSQLADAGLADALGDGIAPAEVADMVIEAIRQERFMLITHPHHVAVLEARATSFAAGQLPAPAEFR